MHGGFNLMPKFGQIWFSHKSQFFLFLYILFLKLKQYSKFFFPPGMFFSLPHFSNPRVLPFLKCFSFSFFFLFLPHIFSFLSYWRMGSFFEQQGGIFYRVKIISEGFFFVVTFKQFITEIYQVTYYPLYLLPHSGFTS